MKVHLGIGGGRARWAFGKAGVVVAGARSTLNNRMRAWSSFNGIFSGRADVSGGEMFACAPSTNGVIGAAEGVVAIMLAAGALGEVVETKTAFQPKGGRKGRQAGSLCDVLGLWTGNGNNNGRGRFPFTMFV